MSYIIPENANISTQYQNMCMLVSPFGEDEDKLFDNAEDRNTKIENLKEDLAAKGHDTLTVLDFLDVDKMLQLADGSEETYDAIRFGVSLYTEARAYQNLGIVTDFNNNLNSLRAGFRLYNLTAEVIRRLYTEFKKLIDPNDGELADEGFEGILERATINLAKDQLNYRKFLQFHKMEVPKLPDPNKELEVAPEHQELYKDWVDDQLGIAFEEMYIHPNAPQFIGAIGLNEFKAALRKYAPVEDFPFVEEMNMYKIIQGFQETVNTIKRWNLNEAQIDELSEAYNTAYVSNIITMLNPAKTDEEARDPRYNRPFFGSITLPEVLYNILLVTSQEIRESNAEPDMLPVLSPEAKYVVDLVEQVMQEFLLECDGEIEITNTFAYKFLSLFRIMTPEYVSTNTLIRFNTHIWMVATQAVNIILKKEDGIPVENPLTHQAE